MCFSILHIPHSLQMIPSSIRPSLLLSDEQLHLELLKMTDRYTDELFDPQAQAVRRVLFPVSRLVLDPERFLDDRLESMSKKGMGVVYTHTSDGGRLRAESFSPTRSELIDEFYHPHHNELNHAAGDALAKYGTCLILDCHSFPERPFPFEEKIDKPRPDICLGVDSDHTPGWLMQEAEKVFGNLGFHVDRDNPFTGTLVPSRFYRSNKTVLSLMIEVNRSLYMDESTGNRLASFPSLREMVCEAIDQIISFAQAQIGVA